MERIPIERTSRHSNDTLIAFTRLERTSDLSWLLRHVGIGRTFSHGERISDADELPNDADIDACVALLGRMEALPLDVPSPSEVEHCISVLERLRDVPIGDPARRRVAHAARELIIAASG